MSYFTQYAHGKNDTAIEFQSPTLNDSLNQHVRTSIHLDNWTKELKPFTYYPDPVFDNLTKNVINEASIIIVTVSPSRQTEGWCGGQRGGVGEGGVRPF